MKNKSWYNMALCKADEAEISIYGQIGSDFFSEGITADKFQKDLKALGDVKKINLRVNSPGGLITEGLAIYSILNRHQAYITAYVDGWAASMASVIIMAADKIVMPGNTFLLIHNPWTVAVGDAEDLRKEANELDKTKKSIVSAYQSRESVTLSADEIQQIMDQDELMPAADALDYGFIDEMIDPIEIEDSAANNETMFGKIFDSKKIKSGMKTLFGYKNNSSKKPFNERGLVMKKCLHCGKEIKDEAAEFCTNCGKKWNVAPAPAAPSASDERSRVKEIMARCSALNLPRDFETALIDGGETLSVCLTKILDKAAEGLKPPVGADHTGVVTDEADKFRKAAVESLSVAAGLERKPEIISRANASGAPRGFHALVKEILVRGGGNVRKIVQMGGEQVADSALRMFHAEAITSSDLPNVLSELANKSVSFAKENTAVTFPIWCGEGQTNDFKSINTVSMSGISRVKKLAEGEDFEFAKFSDKKETAYLDTYGLALNFSRKSMINDDLKMFTDVPRKLAAEQFIAIDEAVYNALVSNAFAGPTMVEGSSAMFTGSAAAGTDHANIYLTSGVPSLTSLNAARQYFRNIKAMQAVADQAARPLGLTPRYIIAGPEYESTIENIINNLSNVQVSGTSTYNPFSANGGRTTLIPVISAYLGSLLSSNEHWYLAADQMLLPTFEIYYLNGNKVPTYRAENSGVGKALGITFDSFFDWGLANPDWRGIMSCDVA
ncbi:MAG: ATP-dependent Clp protease proteolytic subunit [Ignavibacteria bacterium]|nr:ATP-dependent Clp protease proteolytic subunit [Ignavibacteria bacterium]